MPLVIVNAKRAPLTSISCIIYNAPANTFYLTAARQRLKFITWPAIAGLLAALLILDRWVLPPKPIASSDSVAATSYAQAVGSASPSVVNIYTAKLVSTKRKPGFDPEYFNRNADARGRQRVEQSLGSGVIMTEQGHILTNNHVIAGADAIQVLLHDGRSASAKVIGTDADTDLAVLQVQLPDLVPVKLGDANTARPGDVVLAIGNPLGFGHSVTQGIVSALGRYGLQQNTYENYIQTDAIIHLGNSGGALIDTNGRLLGINTLIYTGTGPYQTNLTGIGISLAIPVDLATFVMQDLIDYGEVIRGWLGVSVEPSRTMDQNKQSESQEALVVIAVSNNSPAQKAGVQLGDIITHINGEQVRDGRQTMHRIAFLRPGENVAVSVQRNEQSLELQAIVGTLRQSATADDQPD